MSVESIKKGGALTDSVIDRLFHDLSELSYKVWEYAEVGLQEHKSSAAESEYLVKHGFTIQPNIGGMPSAFVAEWGTGKPVFGFQGSLTPWQACLRKCLREEATGSGAPGHGCGHNLLGWEP